MTFLLNFMIISAFSDALTVFADRDAELSVRPARIRGQRPADPGAWREPGVLSQSVDTPPNCESTDPAGSQTNGRFVISYISVTCACLSSRP